VKNIKLYSYKISHDTGLAPNPFHKYCTLACCKPRIRKNIGKSFEKEKKNVDFWVVGISSLNRGADGNKLVYAMRVTDVKTFDEYYRAFPKKIPDLSSMDYIKVVGDNFYFIPTGSDKYEQLPSKHSKKDLKNNRNIFDEENYKRDLSGEFVLISADYFYFGNKPLVLPHNLSGLYQSEGKSFPFREKHTFSKKIRNDFLVFIEKLRKDYPKCGLINMPYKWPVMDKNRNSKIQKCG